jgi:hypothetical protein
MQLSARFVRPRPHKPSDDGCREIGEHSPALSWHAATLYAYPLYHPLCSLHSIRLRASHDPSPRLLSLPSATSSRQASKSAGAEEREWPEVTDDAQSATTAVERIRHRRLRTSPVPGPLQYSRPAGAKRTCQARSRTRAEERVWPNGTDHARSAGDAPANEPPSCTPRIAANAVLSLGASRCGTPGGREIRRWAAVAEARALDIIYAALYILSSSLALAPASPKKSCSAACLNGILTRRTVQHREDDTRHVANRLRGFSATICGAGHICRHRLRTPVVVHMFTKCRTLFTWLSTPGLCSSYFTTRKGIKRRSLICVLYIETGIIPLPY